MRLKPTLILVASCLLFPGCGPDVEGETAPLVPAGGVVTMDGQPLASASVQFLPELESSITTGYFGSTNEAGEFELMSPRGRPGAEVGKYKVVISKFAQEDGSPFPEDADSGDFAADGVEHLPPNYSEAERSELTAEVPLEGKTDFTFALTSE